MNTMSLTPEGVTLESKSIFENVDCPHCHSRKFKIISNAKYPDTISKSELLKMYLSSSDYQLIDQMVSCSDCSLIYLNPRVNSDIILESYASAIDLIFVKQNDVRIITFKRSLRKILNYLKITPSKNIQILDVGCAGGAFPKAANDLGFSVIGIEPSKWMCEFGKKNYSLDLREGTLNEHNFDESTFDIITLWDVIEHLANPSSVVKEINRILKPNGHLIVNFPDYASLARKLFRKKWPFFLSVHLIYFTPKTLTKMLNNNGFEVIKISPFWQTLQLGYVLKRASDYFTFFKYLEKFCQRIGIVKLHFTYNLGQTQLIAKKRGKI
jgi:2-polyprenyl-3-methyl-5-hydroxy-6-metoxy-1,4-benzoquinol methylase